VLPAGSQVEHGTVLLDMGAPSEGQLASGAQQASVLEEGGTAIRSDTDGTVYLRPEPGSPPFVGVGQPVARSATLALIEVMKTYTVVRSPLEGKVSQVLVTDGAAVRAGDILFRISPG
jgi:acetyl-CoA carboxylase biotin carboxyl carrier protein